LGAALVTTREGLEASLVVGIVLAYLAKTGQRDWARTVWLGTAAALVVSIITGAALFFTLGELEGRSEKVFEAAVMLSAVVVLTWMIFWMRSQAGGIRRHLEARVAGAIATGSALGLALVAFFAVLREGWETALFLFAISESSTPATTAVGAAVGLAIAVLLGYLIFQGSRRLSLRHFFTVTGILLVVFAAGLLAHATHELQEAGILPELVEGVWSTAGVVGGDSHAGRFLEALFGYNPEPSLLEVLVWIGYVGVALTFFLRPLVRVGSRERATVTA
jgi:high-affinity iron transporter